MIAGDVLTVPVTVYNSRNEDATFEYTIVDREVTGNEAAIMSAE